MLRTTLFVAFLASCTLATRTAAQETLIQLAEQRFPDLKPAERQLCEKIPKGDVLSWGDADPAKASQWGAGRVIRAECISWICTDERAKSHVPKHKGIGIHGALLEGRLDLVGVDLGFPLEMPQCSIINGINLRDASVKWLNLSGTHTGPITASRMNVGGVLHLGDGFRAEGGVVLRGAIIGGPFYCSGGSFLNKGGIALDATNINAKGVVYLRDGFRAEGEVRLSRATVGLTLVCSNGSFINRGGFALEARDINVKGGVYLNDGFKAEGEVRLSGATIGGPLDCSSGSVVNKGGDALVADVIDVKGSVFLNDGFYAEGRVSLQSATINTLECGKGTFLNTGGHALVADRINVKGSVSLDDEFTADGEVRLQNATIGRRLVCSKGSFICKEGYALVADGIDVEGSVLLNDGFKAEGEVRFQDATIGALTCRGTFSNKGGHAILADRIYVKGSVLLDHSFKAEGDVRFRNAAVGELFVCTKGSFCSRKGFALLADGIDVKGDVYLDDGFKAEGGVLLQSAKIGRSLICTKGSFVNKKGHAILADGIDVKGSVFLNDGFKAEGEVQLAFATIGRQLICTKGSFVKKGGHAVNAESIEVGDSVLLDDGFKAEGRVTFFGATIGGYLKILRVAPNEEMSLDLADASVGVLWDEVACWPAAGKLRLSGLVYHQIAADAERDPMTRIRWLRLSKNPQFDPQPYEQLASVYQRMGDEESARQILIAKVEDRIERGRVAPTERILHYTTWIIGYGYRPLRALWVMTGFTLLGFVLFWLGMRSGKLVATKSGDLPDGRYPRFNSFVYSVDAFVPIVNLHHAEFWMPLAGPLRAYLWIHIIAGWTFTTLLVVGFTGLVKG